MRSAGAAATGVVGAADVAAVAAQAGVDLEADRGLPGIDHVQLGVDTLIRLEQTLANGTRGQVFARFEVARGDRVSVSILQREAKQRQRLHAVAVVLHRQPDSQSCAFTTL